jgi:hypothetical protein
VALANGHSDVRHQLASSFSLFLSSSSWRATFFLLLFFSLRSHAQLPLLSYGKKKKKKRRKLFLLGLGF